MLKEQNGRSLYLLYDEIAFLGQWIDENISVVHPIVTAAIAHYNMVRSNPFDDGNRPGERILMNIVLLKKGFPPAIIANDKRRKYLDAFRVAGKGNNYGFIELASESCTDMVQKSEVLFLG